ncbi:MAG: hypothetical protein EPN82_09530 [Bacteroidetes bacterium]|nr:MAG: hypothetical protein EPN82_09530 [Bacteroidota bacterium]
MSYFFTKDDINTISGVLGGELREYDNSCSWKIENKETSQTLVLSIHNNIQLNKAITGSLISVQTQHGYFEMHGCMAYMVFEPDEVIFVFYNDETLSSLIVGKQCSCSMFGNISRDILNADFSELDAAVLMAAMQLSLTETILA